MKPLIIRFYRLLCVCAMPLSVSAQDTTYLSLSEAEAVFFKQNLSLLAAHCHVEAERAGEIQAKLYPNPILGTTFNLHDPESRKWLHTGRNGQSTVGIEQLILLGGKRKAALDAAKANSEWAEANLKSLIRELLHELRTVAYTRSYLGQNLSLNAQQRQQLELLGGYLKTQVEKNNIPVKDLIRIQSAKMRLINNENELREKMAEYDSRIKILLGTTSSVRIKVDSHSLLSFNLPVPVDSLYALALRFRPEMEIAGARKRAAEREYALERKQAIPDITLSADYDRQSGAFRNEFNAGISIPMPLFNRNQGNIIAARQRAGAAGFEATQLQQQVLAEIDQAYANWINRMAAWKAMREMPRSDFEELLNAATSNYRKGNLNLLEFMDLFESTTDAFDAAIDAELQLVLAAEQLRYVSGAPLF